VCWLEYACPSYRGRILNTGDVGYVFGTPPVPRPGQVVLPGKVTARITDKGFTRWNWDGHERKDSGRRGRFNGMNHSKERRGRFEQKDIPHPTPRRSEHVRWAAKWFAGKSVIDPFCGSGMTLLQCKKLQIPVTGIEIEERYCEVAVSRLQQEILALEEAEA
jgi:DNA methylase